MVCFLILVMMLRGTWAHGPHRLLSPRNCAAQHGPGGPWLDRHTRPRMTRPSSNSAGPLLLSVVWPAPSCLWPITPSGAACCRGPGSRSRVGTPVRDFEIDPEEVPLLERSGQTPQGARRGHSLAYVSDPGWSVGFRPCASSAAGSPSRPTFESSRTAGSRWSSSMTRRRPDDLRARLALVRRRQAHRGHATPASTTTSASRCRVSCGCRCRRGELEINAGDVFEIPPGHDAWVVGDEPWVSIDFEAMRTYGRSLDAADERRLASILLTDIVDSTRRAAEVGAERWRHLVADHNRKASNAVDRYRGRLVKTTGDGVLRAIRWRRARGPGRGRDPRGGRVT